MSRRAAGAGLTAYPPRTGSGVRLGGARSALPARYHALLDGLPCGILITDPQGELLEANLAIQKRLGLDRPGIASQLGPGGDWLVAREDGTELAWEERPWMAARTVSQSTRSRVIQIIPPRQDPIWFQVDSWPETDVDGRTTAVVACFTDVTALKEAEAELREGEARFQNVFDHSPLGIAILDRRGLFQLANPALEAMLGCSNQELAGTDLWRCVHPRHRSLCHTMLAEFGDGSRERGRWEWLLLRADGTSVWGSVMAGVVASHPDPAAGLVVAFEDISERRRAEQELRESREHLLAVVGNAPVALFAVDRSARFLLFEGRGADRFGLPVGPSMVGVSAMEAFHRRPEVVDLIHRCLAGEAVEEEVVDVVAGHLEVRCSPVRNTHDQVTGLIGVLTDVSERTLAEAAHRANAAKSLFLADVSHQVRTPLNSILGFSQLLQQGAAELDPRQRRYVNHIKSSGRHLLSLVDDILDLSKVESGLIEVERESFAAQELIEDAVAQVRPMADAKQLKLRLGGTAAVRRRVWLDADRRRALQILLNLLSNAIKYTPRGGRIAVSCKSRAGWARVTVADTGTGIFPEQRDRILHELAELDSGPPSRRITIGLGLSLSSRLAKLMGGRIEFDSVPGRGSEFTFVLPAGASRPASQAS